MKRRLLIFFAFLFIIAGCYNSTKVDYEGMLKKIVMNAPNEYVELHNKMEPTNETYADDLFAYFNDEFKDFISEKTIIQMTSVQSISHFYNKSMLEKKILYLKIVK